MIVSRNQSFSIAIKKAYALLNGPKFYLIIFFVYKLKTQHFNLQRLTYVTWFLLKNIEYRLMSIRP
jgi:hypothetical protein